MKSDDGAQSSETDADAGSFEMMSQAAVKADTTPHQTEQPPSQSSQHPPRSAGHESSQNITLSSYQQWRLLMSKNGKLLSRDVYNTVCITLVPALLVFGFSSLTLLGTSEQMSGGIGAASTMRDGSVASGLLDKFKDDAYIFHETSRSVGDVLFAQTITSPPTLAADLCQHVMNTHNMYSDALTTHEAYTPYFGSGGGNKRRYNQFSLQNVMTTTCGVGGGSTNGTCGCATSGVNQQVFSSVDTLDDHLLALASDAVSRPVTAAIVVTSYDAASKTVAWNFRYNRTIIAKTGNTVNDFTFWASYYWSVYSGSSYLALQRFVDSFFIRKFSTLAQPLDALEPHYQLFPVNDWSFDGAKFGFLGGTFQW